MSVQKLPSRTVGDFTTNTQIVRLSIVAAILGVLCAFVAVLLIKSIGFITNVSFYHRISFVFTSPTNNHLGWWVVLIPAFGGLMIGLIARYGSEKIRGHGIPEAIEAMLINESKVQPKVAIWKPISAALSIGTGGPFGAEGPIIMTGGSVGSLLAQFLHFSPIERRIMLVCGAAGGMSATFAAPISSVLFAVELLMFEFRPRSLVPIALASAVADVIRISMLGSGPIFPMPQLQRVPLALIVSALVIGLVGSVLAVLLTKAIYGMEDMFHKLPIHWMWWPALGGLVVGIGGYISPRALGVGYESIAALVNNQFTLAMMVGLLVVKTVIWVVSLSSGTSGGILAPILIIGGSLGALVGHFVYPSQAGVFALLGMSAIFAGVTRTPLTSIMFPLELTHNQGALLPLLLTSAIATGVSALVLPRSILTEKIARRGLHLTREYATDPLQMHLVKEVMVRPMATVLHTASLQEVAGQLIDGPDTFISVIDEQGGWVGMVDQLRILRAFVNPDVAVLPISAYVETKVRILFTDTAKNAMELMMQHDAAWCMVVDEDQHPLGGVTIASLMQLRRTQTAHETQRSRVFALRRKLAPKLLYGETEVDSSS